MKKPDYDIVIVTMSRWDGIYSSAVLSMAKELARSHRVFYIDHPFSYKDIAQGWKSEDVQRRKSVLLGGGDPYHRPTDFPENFVAVTPKATLPINWLSPGAAYESGSRFNDRVLNRCLNKLIRDHGIQRYIFLNSFDPFFFRNLKAMPAPLLRIYQSRDDITQESYIARHGVQLEKEQILSADLALATSRALCKKLTSPEKEVEYLPNAANTELFGTAMDQKLPRPNDLPEGEIIGYTGNISRLRIDFELLTAVAESHPHRQLVLIGELRDEAPELQALPNVHFLGPRPLSMLPAYLQYMSCAIIPFALNTLTESIYPLKLNEYLAAGLPVVATPFSEDIRDFSDVALLHESRSEFCSAVSQAIEQDSEALRQTRNARAALNSWTKRAARFLEMVDEKLENSPSWAASSVR